MAINIEKNDCCGCTACMSVCAKSAITMQEDEEGFLYPHTDMSLCNDCGLCNRVCPIIRYDKKGREEFPSYIYALHHKDFSVWKDSSSGGAFSAISDYVFAQQGCVFGAAYNDVFEVRHVKAENPEDALIFRGSKYVQSDIRGIYQKVQKELKKDRLVLFSGTPCQVEGLNGYLNKQYNNLITVDLVCHCVPSPKIFSDYIRFVQDIKGKRINKIMMKDKTLGWGNQKIRITFEDESEWFDTPETNLWSNLFYSQLISRPSCHSCRFANFNRPGDMTIGDFWGIEKSHPDFFDTRGISLLFVNTEIGHKVFNSIKSDLKYLLSSKESCSQPNLFHPVAPSPQRELFWQDYRCASFPKICKAYLGYGKHHLCRNCLLIILNRIRKYINK